MNVIEKIEELSSFFFPYYLHMENEYHTNVNVSQRIYRLCACESVGHEWLQ